MKYQVIARRYRPRRFNEVVGQDSVGTTLRNAILQERLAHAYLFAGPRGVGKTSMARIFAKALNCPRAADRSLPQAEWGTPCDECDSCRAISIGEDIDVVEVDGASYRGIDEVRDIVQTVQFAPSRSPYKVFIIDEVHMLTREAFNALLKTLEEPPAHVKFIFATTEAHKIPETVLSRCQRFDFRPIGEEDIVRRLEQICTAEGVKAEAGLMEKMARYGRGGMRDAQTLLDQSIAFAEGGVIRCADLERITGRIPDAAVDGVTAAIAARDPRGLFRALGECFSAGADPAILLEQVIERLRERLHAAFSPQEGDSAPGRSGLDPRELDLSLGRLQILHETAIKLRGSPYPRLAVELALVKLSRLEDPRAIEEALAYLKGIEGRLGSGAVAAAVPILRPAAAAPPPAPAARGGAPPPSYSSPPPPRVQPAAPISPQAAVEPSAPRGSSPPAPPQGGNGKGGAPCDFARLMSLWDQILIEAQSRYPTLTGFLGRARLREASEPGTFSLLVDSEFHLRQLREPHRSQNIQSLVSEVTGASWRMRLDLDPSGGKSGGPPPSKSPGMPAQSHSNRPSEERSTNGGAIREDPVVKKSLDLFKGKIV